MLRSDTTQIKQRDLFCAHKGYNVARGSFGGLKAPSQFMFELPTNCEDVFVSMSDAVKHDPGVWIQDILHILPANSDTLYTEIHEL